MNADTSAQLWRPGDFNTPDRPARLFGRDADLWTEIGFGNGDFLCDLAAERPTLNLLGIETSPTCIRKALKQARRRELHNLQLILAPAEFVLRDLLPRKSLDGVYINFPSPWPKSGHEDRRLLDADFWTTLADRVRSNDTPVQVTTDRADYLDYALDQCRTAGWFSVEHLQPPPSVQTTKYARRARQEGRPIQTIRATRCKHPEPVEPLTSRRLGDPFSPRQTQTELQRTAHTMHHATLSGRLPELNSFDKLVRQEDERTGILLDCFQQVGRHALLFTAQTNEPDLEQQVLIEVVDRSERPDKEGDLMVRMRPFSRPLATDGTRILVDMVVDLLVDKLDVADVIDRKY